MRRFLGEGNKGNLRIFPPTNRIILSLVLVTIKCSIFGMKCFRLFAFILKWKSNRSSQNNLAYISGVTAQVLRWLEIFCEFSPKTLVNVVEKCEISSQSPVKRRVSLVGSMSKCATEFPTGALVFLGENGATYCSRNA